MFENVPVEIVNIVQELCQRNRNQTFSKNRSALIIDMFG